MPNYKTHLIGGVFSFLIICLFVKTPKTPLFTLLVWFFCALLGSLFPDVDTKSKGQMIFYRVMLIVVGLLCIQGSFMLAAGTGFVSMLPMVVRHRGIFHSYLFTFVLVCATALAFWVYKPTYFSFVIYDLLFFIGGLYSHLFLDFGPWRRFKFFRN